MDSLKVRSLEVVDENNVVRLKLGLCESTSQPFFVLKNGQGQDCILVAIDPDGCGRVQILRSESEQVAVGMILGRSGNAGIEVVTKEGYSSFVAESGPFNQ
jgi:hypothetical protein